MTFRAILLAVQTVFIVTLLVSCPLLGQENDSYRRAVARFRSGDFAESIGLFSNVEERSPGATDALLYKAKALINLQRFPEADTALREYLNRHANSEDALYLLGFVLHREQKPRESLEIYTRAAAVRVPNGDDLKIVGLDYVLLSDYSDAIKWLERAVEFEPQNKEAWYYLGRAYYSQGRLTDAGRAFSTVLQLSPRDARAENNLGLVFESQAKPDQAIIAYRNAIEWQQLTIPRSEQPYLNLGSLLLEQNQTDEAIAPLEESVKLAPADATCRLKLGIAYLRANRLTVAQRELEEAIRIDPENAAAHFQLARAYKQLKLNDRAKAEFAKAGDLHDRAATKAAHPQP